MGVNSRLCQGESRAEGEPLHEGCLRGDSESKCQENNRRGKTSPVRGLAELIYGQQLLRTHVDRSSRNCWE